MTKVPPETTPALMSVCCECGAPEYQAADEYVHASTRYWPGFLAVALFIAVTLGFFVAQHRSSNIATSANPLAPFLEQWTTPVSTYSQRPPSVTVDAIAITIVDPVDPITGMQSVHRFNVTAIGLWVAAAFAVFLIPGFVRRRILHYRYDIRMAQGHCVSCNYPFPRATDHGTAILTIAQHRCQARQKPMSNS